MCNGSGYKPRVVEKHATGSVSLKHVSRPWMLQHSEKCTQGLVGRDLVRKNNASFAYMSVYKKPQIVVTKSLRL